MESKSLNNKDYKHSSFRGIALVFLATLLTSAGLASFKLVSSELSFSFDTFFNLFFILGVLFYLGGAVLLLLSFKYGELSTLYPFISLSYVWTFVASILFFKESHNIYKILGCILIVVGVSILGISVRENSEKKKIRLKTQNKDRLRNATKTKIKRGES